MTKLDKKQFVIAIIKQVKEDIFKDLDKVNKNTKWEGVELRWLIRGRFNQIVWGGYTDKRSKRYKDFDNECMINGLY